MNQRQMQVLEARPAPEGFGENVLGLVTFGFELTSFDKAVEFTRYVKNTNGTDGGKNYPVAAVKGAEAVLVYDAQLLQGDRGPWLASNGVEVPRDVSQAVTAEAMRLLNLKVSEAGLAMPAGSINAATSPTPFAPRGQAPLSDSPSTVGRGSGW